MEKEDIAGNRPLIRLDGINNVISERMNEEGIDTVQQMALSNAADISSNTKFLS
jgi:predicted flap endonuclease-1-like 5' DNA nuclease